MENRSRKCRLCTESGPNQTKLPRHYIRRKFKAETHLELSDENLCDKCLFEIERDVFSVKELIEIWAMTCKYDKCTQPATVPGNTYMLYVLCENILSNTL